MIIHSQFSVLQESITEIRANEKVRTFMDDWDFLWPCNRHYADPHSVKRICVSLFWQNEQNSGTLVCLWWACVSRLGLLSLTGKSPSLTVMLPPVSSILFRFAFELNLLEAIICGPFVPPKKSLWSGYITSQLAQGILRHN